MAGKPVIGLIGGIGSGKSRVADALVRRGGYLISGDRLGHEALAQPDIQEQVVRHFGPEVLDGRTDCQSVLPQGAINRRRLGAVVFADPAQRRALEAMVFPWIERRIDEEIAAARADPAVALIVLDAAILLEAGWNDRCDRLVYVHAPRATRLARLADQRGWSAKEVAARENAQLPLTEKVTRADDVVDNTGPPEPLERQIDRLLRTWGITPRPAQADL
jgi:dephospho-CoA kinase